LILKASFFFNSPLVPILVLFPCDAAIRIRDVQ
jgi:hypothetical protein